MSSELVFATDNFYNQGFDAQGAEKLGICTAAAMAWARKSLQQGSVDSFDELGVSAHMLNMQMSTLRRYDADPDKQCEMADLRMVGDSEWDIDSVDHVTSLGKDHPDAVVLFWTADHTMAYRYQSGCKEFFDIEVGLYRAALTKDIEKTMKAVTGGYGPLVGARVVALREY